MERGSCLELGGVKGGAGVFDAAAGRGGMSEGKKEEKEEEKNGEQGRKGSERTQAPPHPRRSTPSPG
jgi:hypothetical protein